MSSPFLSGAVEGFYGREWNWPTRHLYADFLLSIGLNSYLYCPKSDACLRKNWHRDWPADVAAELARLARAYREKGLNWGVGLSPYALYRAYSAAERARLRDKLARIDDLGGNLLAVLFDDMPGDCDALAQRQADIICDVRDWTRAEVLLACPTYYSHDPVLEQHFGPRPHAYWEDLGRLVPMDVGLFWTGNQVCSTSIALGDLDGIASNLRRSPVLWDNYPVNDGEKACNYLRLAPLPGREAGLREAVAGHFCNPMNEALLSRYPLSGLGLLYGEGATNAGNPSRLEDFFTRSMARQLRRDQATFEARGLRGLAALEKTELINIYTDFDDPAAAEIVSWLQGDYAFDPACLTG